MVRVGRHRVFCEIASGGTASVHLACLVGPGAFASVNAIKRLHPHLAREEAFRTMLLDEARLSARVVHPNVVRTLDVLEEKSDVFIVMEYAHGLPLVRVVQRALERGENVPVDVAIAIGVGMLHGLHAAHEAVGVDGAPLGIVHRDVSPQNVIVGPDGSARILDFGIAKARSRLTTTEDGIAKGKQGYMAPEQLLGETIARETDVFGAGIVVWELIAGERLFPVGAARSAIAHRIHEDVTLRPSESRPDGRDVPDDLDEAVLRALRRDPAERYATALDMADALASTVTPATPAKVGAWLDAIAGEELRALRDRVAHIEQLALEEPENEDDTVPAGAKLPAASPLVPDMITQMSVTQRLSGAPQVASTRGRTSLSTTAVLLGFALLVGLVVAAKLRPARSALASPPPAAAEPLTEMADETAPAPATAPSLATATGPASAAALTTRTHAPLRSVRPPKSKRSSSSKEERCQPPFTFDDEGHKIYKPECY